jgi:hypothetical protein
MSSNFVRFQEILNQAFDENFSCLSQKMANPPLKSGSSFPNRDPLFENSWPSGSNFKSFSRSIEQFFLTVRQNNFGNKIPNFSTTTRNFWKINVTSNSKYNYKNSSMKLHLRIYRTIFCFACSLLLLYYS